MPFNTLQYIFLLLLTALVSRVFPFHIKVPFILLCSLLFIAWINPFFLACIFGVSLISFGGAWAMSFTKKALRNLIYALCMVVTTGILLFFKYPETILGQYESWSSLFMDHSLSIDMQILLPIGISYYVFQSLGYLTEVYLGTEKPTTNFVHYLLFLSFMPKLLAGPVERSNSFLPQLVDQNENRKLSIHKGVMRMVQGTFKKIIIADGLETITSPVFHHVESFSGLLVIVISILFVVQVYMDLSGYTDLAIGAGLIFGFKLTENFNRPFRATSIADFWRRWHISLSSWVSDYVYRPISLYLTVKMGWKWMGIVLSLFISFALIGIWHGEKITFLYFGLIQGVAIGIERIARFLLRSNGALINTKLSSLLGNAWVLMVFTFSCTFFVTDSMEHVTSILSQMFLYRNDLQSFSYIADNTGQLVVILVFILMNAITFQPAFGLWYEKQQGVLKWSGYLLFAALTVLFASVEQVPFIYQRY